MAKKKTYKTKEQEIEKIRLFLKKIDERINSRKDRDSLPK